MLVYLYNIYYYLKEYLDKIFTFRNQNAIVFRTDLSSEEKDKIKSLEDEIDTLNKKVDLKYVYRCLRVVNGDLSESTNLSEIMEFLNKESEFISNNSDNLNITVNIIQKNTYILNLIDKFKIIKEIKEKEEELAEFKKNIRLG